MIAFIPYPLIFGAITDSACMVWEKACGKKGNCWLYDQDKFRYYLHGSAFAFMMVGTCLDIGVIALSSRLKNFYDEDEEKEQGKEESEKEKEAKGFTNEDTEMKDIKLIKPNDNLNEKK